MPRNSLYNENTFPLLGEGYARNGLNDLQIAKNLNISKTSFYDYQRIYTSFSDAIKRGRRPVDIEVENALLKRALGFEYEEKLTEIEISLEGVPSATKIKTTKKLIPADVGAIAFWLKNRKSSDWRDRQALEHTGKDGKDLPVFYRNLNNDDLAQAILLSKKLHESDTKNPKDSDG